MSKIEYEDVEFGKRLTVTLEFTPGTLVMREEYVCSMLYQHLLSAFRKAQRQHLQETGNPWVRILVALQPEGAE
jgi:hypothetical protein